MTQTSTIHQILSDAEQGLLPYMNHLLQNEEFANFRAQFSFHAENAATQVKKDKSSHKLQTTVSVCLKFVIVSDNQTHSDEDVQLALEFQELLDAALVQWSHSSSLLLSPITQVAGSFGKLEETNYRGAYLPGIGINRNFELTYSPVAEVDVDTLPDSSTKKREPVLYSPGQRTPQSGQYEVTNLKGEGTGVEVTSTQGNPLPPTPESHQLYKLVDPTKHKNVS